jgi:prepilin-type processing-associated H-X9-DG protein
MQCSNNQKQVVLAMHNYHDVHQSFPWGTRGHGNGTWAVQILPFIEKNQIHSEYDWNVGFWDTPNSTLLTATQISTFTCPSDGNNGKTSYWMGGYEYNYVVCMGRERVIYPYIHRNPQQYNIQNCLVTEGNSEKESQYRAMFTASCFSDSATSILDSAYPLTTTFADVIDGTSNTVAISETVQGVDGNGGFDRRGLIWWGPFCHFNTNLAPNTISPDLSTSSAGTAYDLRHPLDLVVTTTGDPNAYGTRFSARSWHTGGVNAGLADGSVRFIQDQINLTIWRAVGSTNGGEIESLH